MSKLVKSVSAEERKFLRKAFWRSATLYAAVSPAKQGASGFCYSLMPALNHFYKDPEKKKEALSRVCHTSIQRFRFRHLLWDL